MAWSSVFCRTFARTTRERYLEDHISYVFSIEAKGCLSSSFQSSDGLLPCPTCLCHRVRILSSLGPRLIYTFPFIIHENLTCPSSSLNVSPANIDTPPLTIVKQCTQCFGNLKSNKKLRLSVPSVNHRWRCRKKEKRSCKRRCRLS